MARSTFSVRQIGTNIQGHFGLFFIEVMSTIKVMILDPLLVDNRVHKVERSSLRMKIPCHLVPAHNQLIQEELTDIELKTSSQLKYCLGWGIEV